MIVILGAGLTGLTAGYKLIKNNASPVVVIEKEPFIGGAARTEEYNGFRFDLGPHRFYTRSDGVNDFVGSLMGNELRELDRLTRICINGKFIHYPLKPLQGIIKLGPLWSIKAFISYLVSVYDNNIRKKPVVTFEDWGIVRFGKVGYDFFFRIYSEKVWGVPCDRISSDFAGERVEGVNIPSILKKWFMKKSDVPASLISSFRGVKGGYGNICNKLSGSFIGDDKIITSSPACKIKTKGDYITSVVTKKDGDIVEYKCDRLISTIGLSSFVRSLVPPPPDEIIKSSESLKTRSLVIVFLTINKKSITDDHWIYFPEPSVIFSRIHEPKNWGEEMSPPGMTSLVAEIFCDKNDKIWNEDDNQLAEHVTNDLIKLGMCTRRRITGHKIIRLPGIYPRYHINYKRDVQKILDYLARYKNLQSTGRNGLFQYTSGDKCIEMGLKSADI